MPQRITGVLTVVLGLAGVLALGVLIVLRIDARRAAATGPKWKRRLIAAGLALLAVTGVSALAEPPPMAKCYDMGLVRPASQRTASELGKHPAWQRLCQTWAQAQDVASGGMGRYPFDRAGQKKLLEALAVGETDVVALLAAGVVSQAEANLLTADLKVLAQRVREYRPTEMRMATCYKPVSIMEVTRERVKGVRGRLELLEKLAEQKTIQPAVVYKVLAGVERQLAVAGPEVLKAIGEAEHFEQTRQAPGRHRTAGCTADDIRLFPQAGGDCVSRSCPP